MQADNRPVIYAHRALDDRENIEISGIETWGDERAASYVAMLDRRCAELGAYPEIGRARDDLRPGLRCVPVGEHVVYYRIRPNEIRISRILHGRQDAAAAIEI